MSDEVKSTRYHRRRRRTRKKKTIVTIESLHPGRAPLGYQPSPSLPAALHHDVCIVTASSSEWPEKENSIQPPSLYFQSSPRSLSSVTAAQFIAHKPSPKSISQQTSLPKSQNRPTALVFNTPTRTTCTTSVKAPLEFNKSQPEQEPFPRDSSSESPPNKDQSKPVTMKLGFYPMSNSQSETPKASTTSELEDLGELASSRPIALSQLYTKANSRTKSGRAVKAFMAQMASAPEQEACPPATSFHETDQDTYNARFPTVHRMKNEEYGLDPCRDDTAPSRIFSQERVCDSAERVGEQDWQRRAEGHHQQNPLNYSDDIGAYYLSRSQERSCVSESPFLKNSNYRYSEQDVWPTEANPIPAGSSLGARQPRSTSRNLMSRSEYIPESSLHLYRASFDRPEDQSPYGSMRIQRSTYENIGSYEVTLDENPPQERYKDYAIIRSGTMLTAAPQGEPLSDTYKYATEFRNQTFTTRTQLPTRALASIASGTGLSGSSTLGSSTNNQTNEEATRFLDKIAQNPGSHIRQTALPDPFVETRASSARKASGSHCQPEELALLAAKLDKHANDSHRRSSTNRRTLSEHRTLRSLCESTITEVIPRGKCSPVALEDSKDKMKENSGHVHAELQTTATGKVLRPPPGLPKPAANRMIAEEFFDAANSALTNARINEANAWFHKDPRGEEILRQQVAVIAQNHAERVQRLTGTDGTTAKQMNLLLGNVIVNLHSHFSECNQNHAANFAAFEEDSTFERVTSFARRRSYFDRDPSVSYWRFPLGHVLSDGSRHSDKAARFSSSDHKA